MFLTGDGALFALKSGIECLPLAERPIGRGSVTCAFCTIAVLSQIQRHPHECPSLVKAERLELKLMNCMSFGHQLSPDSKCLWNI